MQSILDFLRDAAAVGAGVFFAEATLALLVTYRAVRARKRKLAKLEKFETELRKKGKLDEAGLEEAAQELLGGLGG